MAKLLSSLPIGAKVKFGRHSIKGETPQDIVWRIVAKAHSGYPSNSVTLLADRIIDIRMMDNPEPLNPSTDRQNLGNNRYDTSNLDQWLNSDAEAGKWYTSRGSYDQPPTSGGLAYDDRPGFLNYFTNLEKNAILDTSLLVATNNLDGGLLSFVRKVFVPSLAEITGNSELNVPDGVKWEGITSYDAFVTQQVLDYSNSYSKPGNTSTIHDWWLRTAYALTSSYVRAIQKNRNEDNTFYSALSYKYANNENVGVRPALNLSSTVLMSDTTDSDGCYTFVINSAPTVPSFPNITTIYGGKTNSISWGKSTDPDGDVVTYQLECSTNGGEYTQIYSGSSLSYAHLVPFGTVSVRYRIKATDSLGESSAYATSATVSVINNNAPVISGADGNLGVKSDDFTGTYTITDANSDTVTVTEAIDGVRIRSLVATLGQEITYGVTENTWLALPNGSHTLTISATDGIDTTVRTLVFTKLVETLKIQNSAPWDLSTKPSRIMLVITRNIPSTATFKVEVCNNGYDAAPTWEDATDAVRSGLVHVFNNTKRTATKWGVLVRVTVERNGATGACYVSAIGGNFE